MYSLNSSVSSKFLLGTSLTFIIEDLINLFSMGHCSIQWDLSQKIWQEAKYNTDEYVIYLSYIR